MRATPGPYRSIESPAFSVTTALFHWGVFTSCQPTRRGLPGRMSVRTPTTFTSNSDSTAERIWILFARVWTANV